VNYYYSWCYKWNSHCDWVWQTHSHNDYHYEIEYEWTPVKDNYYY